MYIFAEELALARDSRYAETSLRGSAAPTSVAITPSGDGGLSKLVPNLRGNAVRRKHAVEIRPARYVYIGPFRITFRWGAVEKVRNCGSVCATRAHYLMKYYFSVVFFFCSCAFPGAREVESGFV